MVASETRFRGNVRWLIEPETCPLHSIGRSTVVRGRRLFVVIPVATRIYPPPPSPPCPHLAPLFTRSLVRLALFSAWKRWENKIKPSPQLPRQRPTAASSAAPAGESGVSGERRREEAGQTSAGRGDGGDGETAAVVADKENMWRQRQALLRK